MNHHLDRRVLGIVIFLIPLMFAGFLVSGQVNAQQQEGDRFQFRATVQAINLSVVVTDKKGRFIPDLEASDFVVLEDGARQEVDFFTSEVTPVTLLVLLDASTSIRPSVDGIQRSGVELRQQALGRRRSHHRRLQ